MSEFHFLRPLWLLALLPAVALAMASLGRDARRAGSWSTLIDPVLLGALLAPAVARSSRFPFVLLLAGWCTAVVALAGPAWERLPEPVHRRADALVIALDLSLSMYATDVSPSRLQRARFKIEDLLATRHDGYTALVAYAGDAHTVTPLSDDVGTLSAMLGALDPSIMPEQGSDPVAAARLAGELVRGAGLEHGRLLLVADALSAEQAAQIAGLLRDNGLDLSVLAVGSATGAPVPLPGGGFARDAKGSIVVPAVDARAMQEAVASTGGRFAELTLDDADLKRLLPRGAAGSAIDPREDTTRQFDQWLDRAPWLACALLPFAALAFRRGWLLAIALVVLLPSPRAQALEWNDLWLNRDQQGARARDARDPARAAQLFRSPGWRGTAAYEAGDYPAAAEAFGADKGADAEYNRGNALARAGQLEEALAAYDAALTAQPGMADATANRQLVEELLREQKQQQQAQQSRQSGEPQESQQQQGQPQQQGQQQQQSQQDQGQKQQQGQQQQQQPQQQQRGDGDAQSAPQEAQTEPRDDKSQQGRQDSEQDRKEAAAAAEQKAEEGGKDADKHEGEQAQAATRQEGEQQTERQQALEQWLRQVPDDPGALLRRKFEYEARARANSRAQDGK